MKLRTLAQVLVIDTVLILGSVWAAFGEGLPQYEITPCFHEFCMVSLSNNGKVTFSEKQLSLLLSILETEGLKSDFLMEAYVNLYMKNEKRRMGTPK